MVAIVTGDIVASRKLVNQDKWLIPFKKLLSKWGDSPKDWKLERGDFFQIEITNVEDVLKKVLEIKALIKKIATHEGLKKSSIIDVRIAVGIGEKTYSSENISESNGNAFIYSGEKFDLLKKENITLGIKSQWRNFDEEMNLYLKLVGLIVDKWTVSSAELVQIVLNNPKITQEEIGRQLGINQSGVSRRWSRSRIDEILEVEQMFRKKINNIKK
jgi:hypothetical protein